jgi:outer membrane receptor protein involved in Fe transport
MFKTKKINRISKQSALLLCVMYHIGMAEAEPLKTDIPANINIQSQPLGNALKQFATQTGKNIIFDKTLVNGKTAPPVKGNYGEMDALKRVLEDSGLEAVQEDGTIVIRTARPAAQKKAENLELDKVEVRAKRFYEIGPLPGLGLTKEEIPGNVQSISAQEIKEAHSLSLTDLMNRKLQSVTVNDYQGNPFQMDVQYRGFTAGPQIGTPQGLSVFFDGIRVNEPFGDVVNWDMIPMNALAGVDVFPGSNPIFGLNTLGGAFSMKTKDGFNNAGVDADVLTGSYGRKQLQVEGGWNNGTVAVFGAGNFFLEDGWRKNSPSKVNQFFGKASYRGDRLDLNLSTLLVGTDLTGNGLIPSEMYAQDRNDVFTSPDTTKNRLQQFQLSGAFQVNDTFSITSQVYRRNSDRQQKGSDVYTDLAGDEFGPFDRRIPDASEQTTCLYKSSNANGLPDYYILTTVDPPNDASDYLMDPFVQSGITDRATLDQALQNNLFPNIVFNKPIANPIAEARLVQIFKNANNFLQEFVTQGDQLDLQTVVPPISSNGEPGAAVSYNHYNGNGGADNSIDPFFAVDNFYYSLENGVVYKNYMIVPAPINQQACLASAALDGGSGVRLVKLDENGNPVVRRIDGLYDGGPGVVEGTPTALITNNQIKQITDGASLQFNWNFEKHKLMLGVSIDAASATYTNTQQLGVLDASRNGFIAPELLHPQWTAASVPVANNDFSGTNTTKSIYFSETWKPTETWNFNFSGRYNQTKTKNTVAARYGFGAFDLYQLVSQPNIWDICRTDAECANYQHGYRLLNLSKVLDPAETEKFSYYSFNPSIGATWQAKENLNIYANVAKGTRTPSVIELGCALDKTLVRTGGTDENPIFEYKSVQENRECSLPTTLSGDPYLPQIRSTSYDIGMRGTLSGLFGSDAIQWNLGAYQTDLKDDIYFVSVANGQGFFDTIGRTRRRGVEAGISGKKDKLTFSLNYSLNDATFEDKFRMFSNDNSSATDTGFGLREITVKPGSTLPGVALHNLNASLAYDVTDKWRVALSTVMHSDSYVRGNENNEHQPGVIRTVEVAPGTPGSVADPSGKAYLRLPPTRNPGKVPGYAVFNFQTSYKFNKEWTATMLVNNLFDTEYFSAGRLGRNPFSPSINGAIGPDGYNHNSGDWLSTNFIAPGAPRGVWFSLNWHFVPD